MTIYDSSGNAIYIAPVTKDAIIKNTLMEEYYIELSFNVIDVVAFERGCYILHNGRKFEIISNVHPEPLSSQNGYHYTLRFESQQSQMKRCKVFWRKGTNLETTFHNTSDLASFGELIAENVNAFLGTNNWSVGGVPSDISAQTKLISFNGDTCWDAINIIAQTFDVEWWTIENGDKVSIYFGKLEIGTAEEFAVGDAISSIPTRSGDDTEYGTRFYVFGSTRNLPSDYNDTEQGGVANHVSEVRLHLPNGQKYIDAWPNLQQKDVVEQVVFFDDVFPKNTDAVTNISTVNREIIEGQTDKAYVMECDGTPFTPENLIEGETLGCTFTSGSLMGRSFELSIKETNFDKKFEIVAQVEGSGENVIIIPNDSVKPIVGDTFILTGVKLPKARITDAEYELLDVGTSWAARKSRDTNIYDCPTNPVYCTKHDKNYELGQRVTLRGKQFGEGRESRIQGYEKKLWNEYQAIYTVGDNTAYSRFGTIEKNIEATAYAERIGVVQGVGIYVIRSKYDSTQATDENVYSALASEALFLSKRVGGTVNGPVTFAKDVTIGGDLKSEDFNPESITGRGFGITRDENGNAVLTTDFLKVRMAAEFNELVINQTSFQLGSTVFSLAGCEITSVETIGDVFRCYYDNKNGQKFSGFEVGDQARCQRYDAQYNSIIKYYWRVVKGVGDNYVDLYVTGTDVNGIPLSNGAGVPEVGDHIVHFGNRSNAARQNVIVISATPNPSIIQYIGISSFTLPSPSTVISPDGNKFSGAVHIGEGSTGIENLKGLPDAVQDVINKMDLDIDTDSLEFGKYNLLRNSGFTGDYLSAQLQSGKGLNEGSQLFSPNLEYWSVSNVSAQESSLSESGVEAIITNGSLSQTLKNKILVGENYVVSFKAKGTSLTFSIGGVSKVVTLTDEYTRYVEKFTASSTSNVFTISSSNATICEVQLERGSVVSAWGHSMWDNQSELAYYQSLQYLASAMKDGSTTILGGLILSQLIALGNYANGEMTKVTSGINGLYNDDDDVAFWAGGDLKKAILTVQKHRDNPLYQPTEEEWDNMAKFVTTHGGDVFMKGYIYALGGLFKGAVSIANGKILLNADGSGAMANGAFSWDTFGRITRYYPERENWIDLKDATSMSHDEGGFFLSPLREVSEDVEPISDEGDDALVIPTPTLSPYVFCVKGQSGDARGDKYRNKPFATEGQKVLFRVYAKDGAFVGHYLNITALPNQGTITVEYDSTPDDYSNTYYNITLPLTMEASYTSTTDTIEIR